jgi:hypothetical protein
MLKKMGKPLDIEYEGPLAHAQRLQESVSLQRFFQIALPLAEGTPQVMDKVNFDEVIDIHAFATGIPPRALNSPEQVKALRDGRQQAQEEMNDRAKAQEQIKFAGEAAKAAETLATASSAGVVPPIAGNLATAAVPRR